MLKFKVGEEVVCWYPDATLDPYITVVRKVVRRKLGGLLLTVGSRPPCPTCGHRIVGASDEGSEGVLVLGHEWFDPVYNVRQRLTCKNVDAT